MVKPSLLSICITLFFFFTDVISPGDPALQAPPWEWERFGAFRSAVHRRTGPTHTRRPVRLSSILFPSLGQLFLLWIYHFQCPLSVFSKFFNSALEKSKWVVLTRKKYLSYLCCLSKYRSQPKSMVLLVKHVYYGLYMYYLWHFLST